MPAAAAFLAPAPLPYARRTARAASPARPAHGVASRRGRVSATAADPSVPVAPVAPVAPIAPDAPDAPVWRGAEALSGAAAVAPAKCGMNIDEVMRVLPHRYPFLLVDKVVAFESGKRAVAVKAVSVNEPFFQGHFPDRPIMPGVLQVEALAQTGGIVMRDLIASEDGEKRDFFFGGVDNVRWRKPVVPGDVLYLEATLTSYKPRFGIAKVSGKAYVDGKLACEADLTLVVDVRGKAKKV
jgi:3-hydroxyacyl-[acyl-carrier-protein] dehydratase